MIEFFRFDDDFSTQPKEIKFFFFLIAAKPEAPPIRLDIQPKMSWSISVIPLACCLAIVSAGTNSVLLYSKVGQLVTSSTLVWQSYTGDEKQLEYGVVAAKFISEAEHYPMYVCRALIEGIYVPGHTKKHQQRVVCIVTMHMNVDTHFAFDILLNKENGGKLSWKPWSKFSASIPTGAVSAVSTGHVSVPEVVFHFCFVFFYESTSLQLADVILEMFQLISISISPKLGR